MHDKVRDWKDLPEEQDGAETREEAECGRQQEQSTVEERLVAEIDRALANLSLKIDSEGLKVGDLVKLLQVRKELTAGRPTYVNIRWVGECQEQTPSET